MNDFKTSPGEEPEPFEAMEGVQNTEDEASDLEEQESEEKQAEENEEREEKESMEKADRLASTEVPDLLSGLQFKPSTLLHKEYDPDKILEKKDVQAFLAKHKDQLTDEAYAHLEEQVQAQIEREVKPRWEIEQKIANDRYRTEAKQDVLKAMQFTEKDLQDEDLRKGGLQAFEKQMMKRGKEAISSDNPLKDEIEQYMNEQMGSLYTEWKDNCDKILSEADMKSMNVINAVKNQIQTASYSRSELVDNVGFWKDKSAYQSFMKTQKMPGFEKNLEEVKGLDSKKHAELSKVVDGLLGDQGYEQWKKSYVDVQVGRLDATKKEVDKAMTLSPEDIANEEFANNPKAFQEAMFRKMGGIDPTSLENEQEAELKKYISELSDKKYGDWQKLHSGEMTTEGKKGLKQLMKSLTMSKKEMQDEKYDDPKEFEKLMRKKGKVAMKDMPDGVRAELEKNMGAQIKQLHQKHLKERKKIVEKSERDKKDKLFKKSRLNVSFSKLDQGIVEKGTPRMNQLRKLPELRPFLGGNNTLFEPLMHIWTVMLDEAGGEAGFQALRKRLQAVKDKKNPQALLSAMSGTNAAREALKKSRQVSEQAWRQFEMGMAGLGLSWGADIDSDLRIDADAADGKGEEDLEDMEDMEEIEEDAEDTAIGSEDQARREESEDEEGDLEELDDLQDLEDMDDIEEEVEELDEEAEESTVIASAASQSREEQDTGEDEVVDDVDDVEDAEDGEEDLYDLQDLEDMDDITEEDEEFDEEVEESTVIASAASQSREEQETGEDEDIEKGEELEEKGENDQSRDDARDKFSELSEFSESQEDPHIEDRVNELDSHDTVLQVNEDADVDADLRIDADGKGEEDLDDLQDLEDMDEDAEETDDELEQQEAEREEQEMLKEVMEALEREQEDALEEEQESIPLKEVVMHEDIDMLEKMMKEKERLDDLMRRVIGDEENIEGLEQLMTELQQMLMLECLNATLDHNRLFDAMQKKLAQEKWWEEQGYVITDEPDFDVFISKYAGDVSVARALQVFCYYINLVTSKSVPRKVIADRSLLKMLVKNPRELMSDLMSQFREFSDFQQKPIVLGFEVSPPVEGNISLTVVIKGEEAQLKQTYVVEVENI